MYGVCKELPRQTYMSKKRKLHGSRFARARVLSIHGAAAHVIRDDCGCAKRHTGDFADIMLAVLTIMFY